MYKKSPPDSSEGLLGVVGMTGFEPATTRPPDVYSTKLSYIPLLKSPALANRAARGGDDLLSHTLDAVPSARAVLTSLFGMGRGGTRRFRHHVSQKAH